MANTNEESKKWQPTDKQVAETPPVDLFQKRETEYNNPEFLRQTDPGRERYLPPSAHSNGKKRTN